MNLTGLHLLLTSRCLFECDHCFVWGSPRQAAAMTLRMIRHILEQARDLGSVEWIFFEGGEPFLYHPLLVKGVEEASEGGFRVGLVTNAYWATTEEDALEWLRPLAGRVLDMSVSADLYHDDASPSPRVEAARAAAGSLGIPTGVISIAQPEAADDPPEGESSVLFKGRAAVNLAPQAPMHPCSSFTECPSEDFRNPGRVHVDPFGNLHICQGVAIGNLLERPLREICETYDPDAHPIAGPLLDGGPVALARRHGVPLREEYADACHLCYEVRSELRSRFPETLTPDSMYGVPEED